MGYPFNSFFLALAVVGDFHLDNNQTIFGPLVSDFKAAQLGM